MIMKKMLLMSMILLIGISSSYSCGMPLVEKKTKFGVFIYKLTHPFSADYVSVIKRNLDERRD